jgi:MraZ protein
LSVGDFRGSAPAKIDDRGRLKVPTDFRRALEETYGVDVFVTSIHGDSTLLYPLQIWDDIEQQLARLPRTHSAKRRFLERVSYYGQQGTLDTQGRIVIPPLLRTSARMVGEVVVLGMQDHLQVWNRELFERRLAAEPISDEDLDSLSGV